MVTTGLYKPTLSEKSTAETLTGLGFAPASGNLVAGIELIDPSGAISGRGEACDDEGYYEFTQGDALTFGYLPPETYAYGPQYAAVCRDGSIAAFGQEFRAFSSMFVVGYSVDDRVLWHQGTPDGTFEGEIGGRPAVVIAEPPDAVGLSTFGRSWIGITTPHGVLALQAINMPVEDALKIAQGIRCDEC
jgi:hypothetical protein